MKNLHTKRGNGHERSKVSKSLPKDIKRFVSLGAVFDGDLYLVGHPTTQKVGPHEEPWETGTYSLTEWSKLFKTPQVLRRLKNQSVVLIFGCMDKRYAEAYYKFIRAKYDDDVIIVSIFVAGGIVQKDAKRAKALKEMAEFFNKFFTLKAVHASGHSGGCGGISHFEHQGKKVYDALGFKAFSNEEDEHISSRIKQSKKSSLPRQVWRKTELWLVTELGGEVIILFVK